MKTKNLFFLFACALAFTACGGDDDVYLPPKDNSKIDDGTSVNTNKNTTGPIEAKTRYEFPHLASGNNVVVVHKGILNDKIGETGVNYCIEWDYGIHAQRWSCYILYDKVNWSSGNNVERYKATTDGSLSQYCQYPNDIDLEEKYRLTADPYVRNGFDHGHICPSADRQRATEANKQTFFITNMQPQYSNFNGSNNDAAINQRSPWFRLETQLRTWASSCDTMYVCKGGTIDNGNILQTITDKTIGKNTIPVPKYFFVALFGKKGTKYKAIGFWMEHVSSYSSQRPLSEYAVSVDELEKLTGIDFFCNLPDDIENTVEKSYNPSDWAGNLQ